MAIILLIILAPLLIGLIGIVGPLLLAIVTLPLQALGVAQEEEKAALETKK